MEPNFLHPDYLVTTGISPDTPRNNLVPEPFGYNLEMQQNTEETSNPTYHHRVTRTIQKLQANQEQLMTMMTQTNTSDINSRN